MAADPATLDRRKKCWHCQRQRLKCDGTLPHCLKCAQRGVECPGYAVKPLRWVSGVASRGQMMGRTYESKPPPPEVSNRRPRSQLVISSYQPKQKKDNLDHSTSSSPLPSIASSPSPSTPLATSPSTSSIVSVVSPVPPKCLVDPILQPLHYEDRYLLDYFTRQVCHVFTFSANGRNPYRELIPMIGSSQATTSVIMAVAACHAVHQMTGMPVSQLTDTPGQSSPQHCIQQLNSSSSSDDLCAQLLQQFWYHKQKALMLFSHDLTNLNGSPEIFTFITALLLALVELFESGAGSWTVHIEGAKQLLNAYLRGDRSHLPPFLQGFITEVMLFEIFGRTLGQTLPAAGIVTTSFNVEKSLEEWVEPHLLTPLSCPTVIIQGIAAVTALFRNSQSLGLLSDDSTSDAIRSRLEELQSLDCDVWALQAKAVDALAKPVSHEMLTTLCYIWQRSAAIYTSCVLYALTKQDMSVQGMVEELLSALDQTEASVLKCLIWPAFVAGAASQKKEQRERVLATLRRIWNIGFLGNSFNATSVLVKLWDRRDSSGVKEGEMWDWISELSSFGEHWNFF
ncbi:Acriflavine sensitivity control protein acr-2 [Paramyrothecium foliicola]|nr:Acriflavine sensitivity control protein acr-2 [Paramyrothecium foliicola]